MTNATPLIAKAINRLVHSGSMCGLATARGACSIMTHSKNILPSQTPEIDTSRFRNKLMAVATNATLTKYAQNNGHGIQAGIRVAMNGANRKCSPPKTSSDPANRYRPTGSSVCPDYHLCANRYHPAKPYRPVPMPLQLAQQTRKKEALP